MIVIKTILKILGSLLILLLITNTAQLIKGSFFSEPLPKENFFSIIKTPTNTAHRGASGEYPENTKLAFEKALEKGADVLELDVWLTKDDEVVVIHDESVDRTTDGKGKVRDFTLQELQDLDAAYNFKPEENYPFRGKNIKTPSLKEVLTKYEEEPVVIDVKKSGELIAAQLAEIIIETNSVERILISSTYSKTIQKLRSLLPGVSSAASENEILQFYLLSKLGIAGFLEFDFDAFFVPTHYKETPILTKPFITAAQARGIPIHVWTINEREKMIDLLDMGVQGILTDYPSILEEVIQSKAD